MAKYKLGGEVAKRYRVKLAVPGLERSYRISQPGWKLLEAMAKRWKLPFRFEERDEWRFIHADGMVLNANAIAGWGEARRQRSALIDQLAVLEANITSISGIVANRPRFQVLGREIIEQFVRTLTSWDEVLEAGMPKEELAEVAPRFTVPVDAQFGVRFQPALFRKYVAGKLFWAMTPPMPFTLHTDHFQAQTIGHPHVYAEMNLCVGDARFDYSNPFQALGMLREWYLGYQEKDVANKQWVEHSRMWWRANGEAFVKRGGAYVIEGPDAYHEVSAKRTLTTEEVGHFVEATNWVAGEVVEEIEEGEGVPEVLATDAITKQPGYILLDFGIANGEDWQPCAFDDGHALTKTYILWRTDQGDGRRGPTTTTYLCPCHFAELGMTPPGTWVRDNFDRRHLDVEELDEEVRRRDAYYCEGNEYTEGYIHPEDGTPTLPATHRQGLSYYFCTGHARTYFPDWAAKEGGRGGRLKAAATEMTKMVLTGELGANRKLRLQEFTALFPDTSKLWRSPCKLCGEELQAHWGFLCPTRATFVLPVGHLANRTQQPLRSYFSFEVADYLAVKDEVAAIKKKLEGGKEEVPVTSFTNLISRLRTTKGVWLDEVGKPREHYVVDTLRKFGRDVEADRLCTDCGRVWKDHSGPNCPNG